MFHNVSDSNLRQQRALCETMLSEIFSPSETLRLEIISYLANVNRELGKRDAKRRHPAGKGIR